MELHGDLVLERPPTRRWVSIVAVVVPVVACVAGVAWFVRAFISPPTVSIPGPITLASAPALPQHTQDTTLEPPTAEARALQADAPAPPPAASQSDSFPMVSALAPANPAFDRVGVPESAGSGPGAWPQPQAPSASVFPLPPQPAFADPTQDERPPAAMEPAAMPIEGPVPLPRRKPAMTVVALSEHVPLPRPRPTDETPATLPAENPAVFHQHGAE